MKILYIKYTAGKTGIIADTINKSKLKYDFLQVSAPDHFADALARFNPDVILSEEQAPFPGTLKALDNIAQNDLNIPFIVVTAAQPGNITDIVNVMKCGASDCILKENISSLQNSIGQAIQKARTEKHNTRDLHKYLVTIDEVFFSMDVLTYQLIQTSVGCEAVYGYTAEEFIADPQLYFRIFHPEDAHLPQIFIETLQKGEKISSSYRIIHKNQSICWIDSKIIPTMDENGKLVRIDGVSRNVTKARQAEKKLLDSERKYRQIVETAQEGIWIINENHVTIFVNQKMCEIIGYRVDEMIGRHNYDFKTEEEKQKTIERLKRTEKGVVEAHESSFISKSGKEVICSVRTNDIFEADGVYYGRLAMMTDITNRKKEEEALAKSEANLSAVIENTTDLVYSIDTNYRFITFNQIFKTTIKQVYGFDIEQGVNILGLLQNFSAELSTKWKSNYDTALNGKTLHFVNEYPFGDDKVYLKYSLNPIRESGTVIGLSCFSRDITSQVKDEHEIKKSAANLNAIIENSDSLIYSLDTNLRYIAFNNLFKKTIFDIYKVEIKPGDKTLDLLWASNPDDARELEEVYFNALLGNPFQFTKEFSNGDSRTFISISVNPIWENEQVIGLSCAARDITKEKISEVSLKKSEASLRTIINNTDMACTLINANRKVVSFNILARKFSVDQNCNVMNEGDDILDCIPDERRDYVLEVLAKTKNGSSVNYQISSEWADGVKWYDLTWAGINDQENNDFGHIFTIKDITEKKKLEMEREKITADLLRRNKALEHFTYVISHNLRAPVANIIGLSSLLNDSNTTNTDEHKIIGSINESANKLDSVIIDLTEVLQTNENINENIEAILLTKLIDEIKSAITNLLVKEQVTIHCDFSQVPQIYALRSYMYSIFYNLITNSIKYRMPVNPPVIQITVTINNGKIQLLYQDNGRGIDTSRHTDELFGLYKRFDTSVEGKGIGLFMVKMQVESMGGSISLKSEINKGTEFILEFPQFYLQQPSI